METRARNQEHFRSQNALLSYIVSSHLASPSLPFPSFLFHSFPFSHSIIVSHLFFSQHGYYILLSMYKFLLLHCCSSHNFGWHMTLFWPEPDFGLNSIWPSAKWFEYPWPSSGLVSRPYVRYLPLVWYSASKRRGERHKIFIGLPRSAYSAGCKGWDNSYRKRL